MQGPESESTDLSLEVVKKAIEAIKARGWDINPFTVADELKLSRTDIYRHTQAMKLIIEARGGSFGMDMRTSLDLNSPPSAKTTNTIPLSPADKIVDKTFQQDANETIVNLVSKTPYGSNTFNSLANLSWKEVETLYYFKTTSLEDYANSLFGNSVKSHGTNGEEVFNLLTEASSQASSSLTAVKSSGSPFARLKISKTRIEILPSESIQLKPSAVKPSTVERTAVIPTAEPIKTVEKPLQMPLLEPEIKQPAPAAAQPAAKSILKVDLRQLGSDIQAQLAAKIKEQLKKHISPAIIETPIQTSAPDSIEMEPAVEITMRAGNTAETITEAESTIGIENKIDANIPSPQTNVEIISEIKLLSLLREPLPPAPTGNSQEPPTDNNQESIEPDFDRGDMERVEIRHSRVVDKKQKEENLVSGDELRGLIQSHIKNAAEQMAEFSHGHSIGSGIEYEVWLNNPARSKFVGSTKPPDANKAQDSSNSEPGEGVKEPSTSGSDNVQAPFKPRVVPPEVRKSCLILGVRPDNITYELVQEGWKKAIAAPGVHPDQGGDTELAVYLNTAKDILMRWLDAQAPKLGKRFGAQKGPPAQEE